MIASKKFKLQSRIESVDEAAAGAEGFVRELGLSDELAYAVDLAVREAVANAVNHGNKLDPEKDVEVTISSNADGIEVMVRDHGSGFKPEDIPDPTDRENLLKSSGRGILFMRSFMDEVEWTNAEGGGLCVRMLKRK